MTTNITLKTRFITAGEFIDLPMAPHQLGSGRSLTRKFGEYVPEALGTVTVGRWSDGSVFRYNGNGRIGTFLRRGDITRETPIPVQVVKIKNALHSKAIWEASNETMKVTRNQKLKARVATAEPEMVQALDQAMLHGITAGPATTADKMTLDSIVKVYNTGDYAYSIYQVITAVKRANHVGNVKVLIEILPSYPLDSMDEIVDALTSRLEIGPFNTGVQEYKDTKIKVLGILSDCNNTTSGLLQ